MQLLGQSVGSYVHKNRLSTRKAISLFNQMLTCVENTHNKGILHRDIKPSNFVFSEDLS